MVDERPTSLPMTRAPTAEMTKQEAKARAPWWMGGEVSQEDEEFPPSSSGEWCASADDAAPVEDDDPVQGQREEVLAGQLVRRCTVRREHVVWVLSLQAEGHGRLGDYFNSYANGILSSKQRIWRWRCTTTSCGKRGWKGQYRPPRCFSDGMGTTRPKNMRQ